MSIGRLLVALLIFPGVLYALPMGWLMLGIERKLRARFQGRIGPPIIQPFYDLVKLFGKSPAARLQDEERLLTALPLLAVGSMIGTLTLLPIFSNDVGFVGDLILLATLLELPPLCMILAGYASRSIYGEVGATREAIVGVVSNVPFLAALIAMATAAGSLKLSDIVVATPYAVRIPAVLVILLCLPAKLRLNPFSLANAEQELLAGPLTEFDGPRLALWEIAHSLEWVVLVGLTSALMFPMRSELWPVNVAVLVATSLVLLVLLTLLASATARLKIMQATRLLWRSAFILSVASIAIAFFVRQGGQ